MVKRVALPDGSVGEFPDGMTDAQIEGVLVKQFAPNESTAEAARLAAHPAPEKSELADVLLGIGDVKRGVGNALHRTLRGLSGGYLGAPEQKVAEGKQAGDYVGEIGTDIALSAAPVAGLSRAMAALKLGAAAPIVANAAYSAATTDEDRGTAALFGGGGAALGAAANRVVSGLVQPSEASLQLLRRGVDLTPGQAGKGVMGAIARGSENIAEGIPGVGRWVSKAREGGVSGWNADLLERVNTAKYPVGLRDESLGLAGVETGREGIKAVQRDFSDAYKSMLPPGTSIQFDDAAETSLASFTDAINNKLPPSARAKFSELSDWLTAQLKAGITADQWKEVVEREIDAARRVAKRDGQYSLQVALGSLDKEAQKLLAKSVGAQRVNRLNELDKGYHGFNVLKSASEKAGPVKRGGALYPSDVAVIAAKRGATDLQDEAVAAQAILGNAPEPAGRLVNTLKTLGAGAAGAFVSPHLTLPPAAMALLSTIPQGRKVLLGQYPMQQFLQENPQIAAQLARAIATQGAQE